MSNTVRRERVAELIREEVAKLIMKGVKDVRLGFVSVMSVRMSPDLRYADVYVSLLGDEKTQKASLVALRNAAGWMRHQIAPYLRLRYVPELRFFADDTLEQVDRLQAVFEQIHAEQQTQPMLALTLPQVWEELMSAQALLITSHTNPDGDSIGSMLALRHLLEAAGKNNVYAVQQDPVPRIYKNLPGAKDIRPVEGRCPNYDVAVIVDAHSIKRVGAVANWLTPDKKWVIIDHHREQGQSGARGFIDPTYAATGEIIVDLAKCSGLPMTTDFAICAYAALLTDTGSFRFSNTTARTLRTAAELMETGIDAPGLARSIYDVRTLSQIQLLRRMLNRAVFTAGGRLAHSYMLFRDLEELKALREDMEGLINFLRDVEGVQVAVIFYEPDVGKTKMSLRSTQDFNCAGFANRYGGGGHLNAAGASFDDPLPEVRDRVLSELIAALDKGEA